MTRNALPGMVMLCALSLCAQEGRVMPGTLPSDDDGQQRNRFIREDETVLPLPITSPVILAPGELHPLTAREKAARALRNSVGARAIANRVLLAGINHATDSPTEWSGNLDGFGHRFASRVGRLWVRQAVQLGGDVAFKTDPRYDICACSGFLARTSHAWKRVLVARKDDGSETIAISRLAGAYVTPMITDQWYPSRLNTWQHKLDSGSQFLMWRGATNMLREFWPEISRKMPFVKRFYGRNIGE